MAVAHRKTWLFEGQKEGNPYFEESFAKVLQNALSLWKTSPIYLI
jgi:hypothetical protein